MTTSVVVACLLLLTVTMSDGLLETPSNHRLIQDVDADIQTLKAHIDSQIASLKSELNSALDQKLNKLFERIDQVHEEIGTVTKCPENALEFEGSCYFVPLWKAPWDGAQKICERLGGHLATLESSKEKDAVKDFTSKLSSQNSKLLNNYFWIGGYDINKNKHWTWVNGKVFSYTNWLKSNYPLNVGKALYQCLNFWTDGWWRNHMKCDLFLNFMCEKEL